MFIKMWIIVIFLILEIIIICCDNMLLQVFLMMNHYLKLFIVWLVRYYKRTYYCIWDSTYFKIINDFYLYHLERIDSIMSFNFWSYYKDVGIDFFLYNFKIKNFNRENSNDYFVSKNLLINNDQFIKTKIENDLFLKMEIKNDLFNDASDNLYKKNNIASMKYFLQVILEHLLYLFIICYFLVVLYWWNI